MFVEKQMSALFVTTEIHGILCLQQGGLEMSWRLEEELNAQDSLLFLCLNCPVSAFIPFAGVILFCAQEALSQALWEQLHQAVTHVGCFTPVQPSSQRIQQFQHQKTVDQ